MNYGTKMFGDKQVYAKFNEKICVGVGNIIRVLKIKNKTGVNKFGFVNNLVLRGTTTESRLS